MLERVVVLMSHHPAVVGKFKDGERDPVSQWFEGDYSFRDFKGRGSDMIELIVDKLET